jgi:hypothetical protein
MRLHAIEHPNQDGRWLVNTGRECLKPYGACPLQHLNVFTDNQLANHELLLASAGMERD